MPLGCSRWSPRAGPLESCSMQTEASRSNDFSLAALFAALDAQRQARGLSWSQAVGEMSRQVEHVRVHPLSASTVTSLRTKAAAEGDGVLQMLLWLHRSP